MSRWTWLGVAGLLLASDAAAATSIGIYLDANAGSCVAAVGPNPRVDLHVIAILDNDVPAMTGAQFQIANIPDTWTPQNVLWVPDVGTAVNLGNPVFPSPFHPHTPGVNVAFPSCQRNATSTHVPIGRLVLLGPPTADNVRLQVQGFDLKPTGHWPGCPFVTDCTQAFVKFCVEGKMIVLNGPPTGPCTTAVEQSTWSNIKAMYRN